LTSRFATVSSDIPSYEAIHGRMSLQPDTQSIFPTIWSHSLDVRFRRSTQLCRSTRPDIITSSHPVPTRPNPEPLWVTNCHSMPVREAAKCWSWALCLVAPTISPEQIARLWTYDGQWLSLLWWGSKLKTLGTSIECHMNKICLYLFNWAYMLEIKACRPAAHQPRYTLHIQHPPTKLMRAGPAAKPCRPSAALIY